MKSKISILLLGVVLTLLGFFLSPISLIYIPSKKALLANKITHNVAKKITKEKKLYPFATGGQMLYEIQMLALEFQGFQEIEIDTARELIVYAVETFVNEVNMNEKIRPYLANYPFTANNIEICIWFYKSNHSAVDSKNIYLVASENGIVEYYPGKPEYDVKKPLLIEKFDEAAKKVRARN